jgi:hypothetical protein
MTRIARLAVAGLVLTLASSGFAFPSTNIEERESCGTELSKHYDIAFRPPWDFYAAIRSNRMQGDAPLIRPIVKQGRVLAISLQPNALLKVYDIKPRDILFFDCPPGLWTKGRFISYAKHKQVTVLFEPPVVCHTSDQNDIWFALQKSQMIVYIAQSLSSAE